jgi:uncharacterized protein YoxC
MLISSVPINEFTIINIILAIFTLATIIGIFYIAQFLQKIHEDLSKISREIPSINANLKYIEDAVKSLHLSERR